MLGALGCAHVAVEPFVFAPAAMTRTTGDPPACFSAPLAGCVGAAARQSAAKHLASPWWYPFHPDLHHRVCRGDPEARRRFVEGVRRIPDEDPSHALTGMYLAFLDGCTTPSFCEWALGVAADVSEPRQTRLLLLEGARRGCEAVLGDRRLAAVGSTLGRSLADEPRWVTSTRDARCPDLERPEPPWDDLAAQHAAGCLDLSEWLERHRDEADATAAALERCVEGHEIRYREADCLRELAGLDRDRAVAWLQTDARRGWGMSSTITRYARTLLRFPEQGRLEGELAHLGLIPPVPLPGGARPGAVLPEEILEDRGRLLRFNPSCSLRYCEHAPLTYLLADLVSPALDDLVIEERWPALERVELGSGPRAVSTSLRGIPVTFHVAEDPRGAGYDVEHFEKLRGAVGDALEAPHELILYGGGKVYRLPIRYLGEWFDLEALVGGLNTVLAERDSDLRFATLDPHCIPCARVVAGPGDGLVEAAFSGLLEPVDPFKELWVLPSFDPALLMRDR